MSPQRLILASASPRRRELLGHLGISFEVLAADIDESIHAGEPPAAYVERLAREKAARIHSLNAGSIVLAADTSVVVDGEVLGKPGADAPAGIAMLRKLSGRAHQVMTGIAVAGPPGTKSQVVCTEVTFRALREPELTWYASTGEGADKAGGYAVQGRAGAFITSLTGSSTSVIGLPLAETALLLEASGLTLPWNAVTS